MNYSHAVESETWRFQYFPDIDYNKLFDTVFDRLDEELYVTGPVDTSTVATAESYLRAGAEARTQFPVDLSGTDSKDIRDIPPDIPVTELKKMAEGGSAASEFLGKLTSVQRETRNILDSQLAQLVFNLPILSGGWTFTDPLGNRVNYMRQTDENDESGIISQSSGIDVVDENLDVQYGFKVCYSSAQPGAYVVSIRLKDEPPIDVLVTPDNRATFTSISSYGQIPQYAGVLEKAARLTSAYGNILFEEGARLAAAIGQITGLSLSLLDKVTNYPQYKSRAGNEKPYSIVALDAHPPAFHVAEGIDGRDEDVSSVDVKLDPKRNRIIIMAREPHDGGIATSAIAIPFQRYEKTAQADGIEYLGYSGFCRTETLNRIVLMLAAGYDIYPNSFDEKRGWFIPSKESNRC